MNGTQTQPSTQEDPLQSLPLYENDLQPLDSASGLNGSSSTASASERPVVSNNSLARRNRRKVATSASATRQATGTSSSSINKSSSSVLPESAPESGEQTLISLEELPLERFKFMDEEEAESDDGPVKTSCVPSVSLLLRDQSGF